MAINIEQEEHVAEKWWHRLFRVLMYGSTCGVLLIAGAVVVYDTDNYSYSFTYSFQPNYEQIKGVERTCEYFDADFPPCEDWEIELGDIITRYRESRDSTSRDSLQEALEHPPTVKPDRTSIEEQFIAYKEARNLIIEELKNRNVRYRRATHWKTGPLMQSVGLTLGIAALWYLFTLMLYKVILYIAHGHTRVRKNPV